MFLDPELQSGATKTWVHRAIKSYFVKDYNDNAEARATNPADKFLKHLGGRAWVLRAVGSNQYEFTHRTFMEYFFARYLTDKHLSIDLLFDEIGPPIKRGEWNLPAHLAIQMSVDGKRNYAERAVQRLLQLHSEAAGGERDTVTQFIAQATEYLQPTERALGEISQIVTREIRNEEDWKEAFVSILQTPNEMQGAIFGGLSKGFAEVIESGQLHKMSFVLDWLKACNVARSDVLGFPVPARLRKVSKVGEVFLPGILSQIDKAEPTSAAACKARFDLTGVSNGKLVAAFGPRLWQASSDRPLQRYDWRAIDFALMVAECADVLAGRKQLDDCSYAQFAQALAEFDPSRYPYAIAEGVMVLEDPKRIDFKTLLDADVVDARLSGALSIAMMGYAETNGPWRVSNPEIATIISRCLKAPEPRTPLLGFAEGWLSGKVQMFQNKYMRTDERPSKFLSAILH